MNISSRTAVLLNLLAAAALIMMLSSKYHWF
ncbi:stress response membrane protein YncL [Enterobacter sp. ENT03]|nr:stress response membrane protein YncL [Enterobacter sp. ENT03]